MYGMWYKVSNVLWKINVEKKNCPQQWTFQQQKKGGGGAAVVFCCCVVVAFL